MRRLALILGLCAAAPAFAQAPRPVLAAITGEGVCTATAQSPFGDASIRLLQAGAGYRILEVETETFKARGPATQVESKQTGGVAYFLDYGSLGGIAVTFRVTPADEVRAKLIITQEKTLAEIEREAAGQDQDGQDKEGADQTKDVPRTVRHEYDCRKKP